MTDRELAEIRQRGDAADIPKLVAEVERMWSQNRTLADEIVRLEREVARLRGLSWKDEDRKESTKLPMRKPRE
ncbi:MAG TPA: hypothetical protein VM165_02555 [Planctomycetaceae bacterium]|nr:hypothetical protein [Planctomycetaceae bacterium]